MPTRPGARVGGGLNNPRSDLDIRERSDRWGRIVHMCPPGGAEGGEHKRAKGTNNAISYYIKNLIGGRKTLYEIFYIICD